MPAPISSQKTIGVASAPTTRLGWRMNRTSSRRASESAGRSKPGDRNVAWASSPRREELFSRGLEAHATFSSAACIGRRHGMGFEPNVNWIMIARRPGEPVGEHFYFLDLIFHLFGCENLIDKRAMLRPPIAAVADLAGVYQRPGRQQHTILRRANQRRHRVATGFLLEFLKSQLIVHVAHQHYIAAGRDLFELLDDLMGAL